MKKKLYFTVSIFAVVGLIIGAYFLFVVQRPVEGEKTVTLEIITSLSATETEQLKLEVITDKGYVFEVLKEVNNIYLNEGKGDFFAYSGTSLSAYITGFLGVEPEFPLYFAFFVNGEYSMLRGISDTALRDGDVYSFILVEDDYPNIPVYSGTVIDAELLDAVERQDNLWIFLEIVAMLPSLSLMAYMIVRRNEH